jgi:hypothetical protein
MSHIVQHRVSLMQNSDSDSRQIATIQQPSNALTDTVKVAAFLALTVGGRYYLTSELHNSVEGTLDTSFGVPTQDASPSPNLMDLSTVRL